MATSSEQSPTQSVGNPGYTILQFLESGGHSISVSFAPTLMRFVNPRYSPHQKVNIAANGSVHVFQVATTEMFELPFEIQDLQWFDNNAMENPLFPTGDGAESLLSFVRYTLNYHENTFVLTTPDGQIETARYMGGIDSLVEASQNSRSQKREFYTGTLTFWRVIT